MNNTFQLSTIIPKEKRAIFDWIKKESFKNDGMIFGGYVRDSIIVSHNEKEFYNKYHQKKNSKIAEFEYWNSEIYPESYMRTLIPNDIDIYFSQGRKYKNFANKLKKKFQNIKINIKKTRKREKYDIKNFKIEITYEIGSSFLYEGKKITIYVDCYVLINNELEYSIEPPFDGLDMFCNSFIETEENIRLSNHTGTILDTLSIYDKLNASMNIMKQIINFETDICLDINTINDKHIVSRIIKLYNNNENWIIRNTPFNTYKENETTNTCIICCNNLKQTELKSVIYVENSIKEKIPGCHMHYKCLIEYLSYQLKDDKEKFLCPYKTHIDFSSIVYLDYEKLISNK